MKPDPSLLDRRRAVLGESYRLFYDSPIELVRGEGTWLFDTDGRRYLDVYNNVPIVGHGHPRVVKAVSRQMQALNTHSRYLHEGIVRYAETLLARMPPSIDRMVYACSGTEAVELALRMATAFTGAEGLICTAHAYHGNSRTVARISPETAGSEPGDSVEMIRLPDPIDGAHVSGSDARAQGAGQVRAAIERLAARGTRPAALIVDTIFSSEGIDLAPPGWLSGAVDAAANEGALFIADEVQAGFGRLGEHFWGFERHQVLPDIVTLGKPMGNGYPVSAVVLRHEISQTFARRASYFNTFGGSPVAAAAAQSVLEVLDDEQLPERAGRVGSLLRSGLRDLESRWPCMAQVRGAGQFTGVEIQGPSGDRKAGASLAGALLNELARNGTLAGRTGPDNNVIKLRPPLAFDEAHVDMVLNRLEDALKRLA
ncbi:MAG: aminotransferase class III-fold pyridoxal phosphate-dependent enzyme [Xanthomonadales bacterium]|nr:aminotransferase class III-fold pyridoxal phosphate-dependent enzyme [Xanthomonadales bacterium]